jgi:hypothetical protein
MLGRESEANKAVGADPALFLDGADITDWFSGNEKGRQVGGLRCSKIVFSFCETSAAAFFGSIVGPF